MIQYMKQVHTGYVIIINCMYSLECENCKINEINKVNVGDVTILEMPQILPNHTCHITSLPCLSQNKSSLALAGVLHPLAYTVHTISAIAIIMSF